MKTIHITKREQHVLMTVVRAIRGMLLGGADGNDPAFMLMAPQSAAITHLRLQPGMTEPDAPVPTPMELESLLERLGDE